MTILLPLQTITVSYPATWGDAADSKQCPPDCSIDLHYKTQYKLSFASNGGPGAPVTVVSTKPTGCLSSNSVVTFSALSDRCEFTLQAPATASYRATSVAVTVRAAAGATYEWTVSGIPHSGTLTQGETYNVVFKVTVTTAKGVTKESGVDVTTTNLSPALNTRLSPGEAEETLTVGSCSAGTSSPATATMTFHVSDSGLQLHAIKGKTSFSWPIAC